MKRVLRDLMVFVWTIVFAIPTIYIVWWAVESAYGVPLTMGSFRFERPWAALLFAGPALLQLAAFLNRTAAPRIQISRVHDLALVGRTGVRTWFRHAPTGARVVASALIVLALMGPQSIHARDTAELEGIDIVLTLDMSGSMEASDIGENRFIETQRVVDDFIQRRPNDRMGAVVFGRDAYTLMPLTTDKQALRTAIAELQLGMIDGNGTAIGNAVGTALNRLRESEAASHVIILLTDGDSNSGNVSPQQAADIARTLPHPRGERDANGEVRRGVKIYTILMGVTGETRVRRGTGIAGRPIWDTGNHPVNPELLQEMAETTGGEYFQVTDVQGLQRSFHTILDQLERTEMEDAGVVHGELYPAFVWPALALLVLSLLASTLVLRRWP